MNAIAKLLPLPRKNQVAALEAELAALNANGAQLIDQLEERQAALAAVEDDDEVVSASGRVTVVRNKLRKVEAQIAELRPKLEQARAAARVQLHSDLREAYAKVLGEFIKGAEALLAKSAKVTEALEALGDAGFRAEHAYAPKLPMLGTAIAFDADILARVRSDFELFAAPGAYFAPEVYTRDPAIAAAAQAANVRAAAAARGVAAANSVPAKPLQVEPQGHRPIRVTLGHSADPPPPTPRALYREVAGEGEILVTVLRSGLEVPSKGQLRQGDQVALPAAMVEPMRKNGAVDLVEHSAEASHPPAAEVAEPQSRTDGQTADGANLEGQAA